MNNKIREQLLQIYLAGVQRVRGAEAVQRFFSDYAKLPPQTHLVAIGKAASSMVIGALEIHQENIVDGLVITKQHHLDQVLKQDARLQCIESDHPVPGENTFLAGRMLLKYLQPRAKPGAQFLFLLSGGASSLVEVLPEGMQLEDLQMLNNALLSSGMDIGQMNRARCTLSQIKGGRLSGYLPDCKVLNLLISDVSGDDPKVIGSGLLTPSRDQLTLSDYPQSIASMIEKFSSDTPVVIEQSGDIDTHIIACLEHAKQAAAQEALAQNFETLVIPEFLEGDVSKAAKQIQQVLLARPGQMVIWGGETTVALPDTPGRGGRNQHLALTLAQAIDNDGDLYILCAGTDGTDGATDDCGGIVDQATVTRGQAAGMDVADYLERADAGSFLEATGDLVTTGPTGTNVMDLVVGIRL